MILGLDSKRIAKTKGYYIEGSTLVRYTGIEDIVKIPEGVTEIGDHAFEGCGSLKEITIPKSVTTIGFSAFEDCSSLKKITISKGVTTIGYDAFRNCEALEKINIPDSVTTIESGAFAWCRFLKEITIPESVTEIGYGAFDYCNPLIILEHREITFDFEEALEMSNCGIIYAPNLRLSDLDSDRLKLALSKGFIKNISKTGKISDGVKEEYYEYILENEDLIRAVSYKILKDEKTLLNLTENDSIPLEIIDLLIRISIKNNTPSMTTILMEYKNKFDSQNKDDFELGTL